MGSTGISSSGFCRCDAACSTCALHLYNAEILIDVYLQNVKYAREANTRDFFFLSLGD